MTAIQILGLPISSYVGFVRNHASQTKIAWLVIHVMSGSISNVIVAHLIAQQQYMIPLIVDSRAKQNSYSSLSKDFANENDPDYLQFSMSLQSFSSLDRPISKPQHTSLPQGQSAHTLVPVSARPHQNTLRFLTVNFQSKKA